MSGETLRAILVGYGYWGPNILRNLIMNPGYDVKYVVDGKIERLKDANRVFPPAKTKSSYTELDSDDYDCVFIATPPKTHLEIARYFIKQKKHVWLEKPAVTSMTEFLELLSLAQEHAVKVFVDHTFVFSSAVRELKRRIENGDFGTLLHINSIRANLGIFQKEVDALYDLAIHDLAIIDYLFPELDPIWVTNLGFDPFGHGQASINSLVVQYQNGLSAAIQVNWISPVKKREFFIIGKKQAAIYDETDQNHKLKIFQQEFANFEQRFYDDISQKTMMLTSYKTGDVIMPKLENVEALKVGVSEFANVITKNIKHSCEIRQIGRIMSILASAKTSAGLGGARVEV
jgi:predicted dehydrogenase